MRSTRRILTPAVDTRYLACFNRSGSSGIRGVRRPGHERLYHQHAPRAWPLSCQDVLQRLKTGKAVPRTAGRAASSSGEAKHPIDKPVLRSHVTLPHPPNLSFPNLVHRRVALNRPSGTTELTKMLPRTDLFLDSTVILLEDVVQILNRPLTAALSEDSFFLGFTNRRRIVLGLVGVDHPRLRVRRVRQRLGQQRFGRCRAALNREVLDSTPFSGTQIVL